MALWLAAQPLVLASKSAAGALMLHGAGIPIEVVPAEIDERGVEAKREPAVPARWRRCWRARRRWRCRCSMPGRLVLGADQTLVLGEHRFSKPADRAAAREQLRRLRGQAMSCIRPLRSCATAAVVFEHCDAARLDHARVLR